MSIINVYAPTEDKEHAVKEEFYEKIKKTYNTIPRHDMSLIAGDCNAKIGTEECMEKIAGRYTLH